MARWSGLAPAVDAHLARWAAMEKEFEGFLKIRQEVLRDGVYQSQVPAVNYPNLVGWAEFAKTWGVPDGDGVIQTPVVVDGATINGREQFTSNEFAQGMAVQLMEKEVHMLRRAETHYVSAPVIRRITVAADEMEPEPLFPTDLITPYGFAVLEEPIVVNDLHPDTGEVSDFLRVAVRAIGWCPEQVGQVLDPDLVHIPGAMVRKDDGRFGNAGPGVMLFIYSTRDDWNASYRDDIVRAVMKGRVDWDTIGVPPGTAAEEIRARLMPPRSTQSLPHDALWPMDVCPWRFNTPWKVSPGLAGLVTGEMDSTVALERKWFLTLMRFCWQRLVVAHREKLTKKASKRIELARRRPVGEYSVLRLRRIEDHREKDHGTGPPLMVRQAVRAHWKRVYCPKLGPARNPDGTFNEDSHRLLWMEKGGPGIAYWRGPEDGPIGPLHKATTVVR